MATDATPLQQALAQAAGGPQIAARLEKRLGLGTAPELRRALYQRIEEAVCNAPDPMRALDVVNSVVQDAVKKTTPGHYFAAVAMKRLIERGCAEPAASTVEW